MQYTTNMKLKKPDYGDSADIADINSNMDVIDSHLADITNKTDAAKGAALIGIKPIAGLAGDNVRTAIQNLFQYANDGKTAVANAVTAKGVSASSSDTFSALASKIGQIEVGDYKIGDDISEEALQLKIPAGSSVWDANKVDKPPSTPTAIASDGDYLYVATLDHIIKYTLDGKIVMDISNPGYSYDIFVDENGYIYVTHSVPNDNKQLSFTKFGSDGNKVLEYQGTYESNISNITVDDYGNIYTTYNKEGTTVKKFDSKGNKIWGSSSTSKATAIAVDASQNVYVTYFNSTSLQCFDVNGSSQWAFSYIPNGMDISIDSKNNLYIAFNVNSGGTITVGKINCVNGNIIWQDSKYGYPQKLVCDKNDDVYIAYRDNAYYVARKLSSNGMEIWINKAILSPNGITVDKNNNAYTISENHGAAAPNKLIGHNVYSIIK